MWEVGEWGDTGNEEWNSGRRGMGRSGVKGSGGSGMRECRQGEGKGAMDSFIFNYIVWGMRKGGRKVGDGGRRREGSVGER